jgi:CelD/BcsL family acetyltransferase involved in cellulose biosynthesis
MRVVEISTAAELEHLKRSWQDLWAKCAYATPFQSPAWLIPWWNSFGPGKLTTLAFYENERLVALAPMFLLDGTVRLLGAGNTDYLDILYEPQCLNPVLRLLVGYLSNQEYDFMDLPSCSPLLALDGPVSKCSVCPVLKLNEVKLSRKRLANLEDARRYLERDGEFSIESATQESVSEMIDALIHLHEARWKQRGQAGVLHSEEVRRFHRSAAPALLQAGLLRLYGLRHRGKWAAVHYCLSAHGRTYYYLGGFDPSMASRSPGNLLIQHSIAKAVECGDREYDFLRGQEEDKYRWGAQDTATFHLGRRSGE